MYSASKLHFQLQLLLGCQSGRVFSPLCLSFSFFSPLSRSLARLSFSPHPPFPAIPGVPSSIFLHLFYICFPTCSRGRTGIPPPSTRSSIILVSGALSIPRYATLLSPPLSTSSVIGALNLVLKSEQFPEYDALSCARDR